MDFSGNASTYVILDESKDIAIDSASEMESNDRINIMNERSEKHSAVWTSNATSILLKLYESNLQMLETPKKKTRIWMAISQNLKHFDIDMTADQVRWKINALTKKYKQCIDSECRQYEKFKYFKEMDSIYSQYNVDCDSYLITELLHKNNERNNQNVNSSLSKKPIESKAVIEMRKIRLANRIDSERNQSKIQLEKQWLVYLKTQEDQRQLRDRMFERSLKLKEEELELRKRELELIESLEGKIIDLIEKEHDQVLQLEREKCDLMKENLTIS